MGATGFDSNRVLKDDASSARLEALKSTYRTINANVELSTWTIEDALAFVDGEFALAA